MARHPITILVISADPLLGRTLYDGLAARGYATQLATTNGEGRVFLGKGGWAAIVLDLSLEDGKGLALLQWARESLSDRLPAMLLLGAAGSAVGDLEPVARAGGGSTLAAGTNTPLDLIQKIEEMLRLGGPSASDLLSRDSPLIREDGSLSFGVSGQGEAIRALTSLAVARETGALRRVLEERVGEIRLVRGGMVASHNAEDSDLLGHMAIEAGLLGEEQMAQILREPSHLPLGVRLVRSGLVSPQAIRALIRLQVRRRVLTILRYEGGRVEWSPEPQPQGDPLRVVVPAIPVAWEATRTVPSWAPGAEAARPVTGRSVSLITPELPLRDPQRAFLCAMDGRTSVELAAERVELPLRDALHLCARLEAMGAIVDHEGLALVPPASLPEQRTLQSSYRDAENRIFQSIRSRAWEEAARSCEKLVEAGVSSPRVYCWLGLARFRSGAPVEKCIPLLHRALALDPSYVLAHRVLARVLTLKNHNEVAAAHERIARLLGGDSSALG